MHTFCHAGAYLQTSCHMQLQSNAAGCLESLLQWMLQQQRRQSQLHLPLLSIMLQRMD